MHVLLVHQAFVSPEEAGGTRHYELARRMICGGHRFTVVASDLSYLTGKRVGGGGLVSRESHEGIEVIRAYTHKSLHRSFVWRVVSFVSFAATSIFAALRADVPDVVIGTTPPIFQAASAALIASCMRRPFVLEVRDLWPAFAIDMGVLRNRTLIRISRWLERGLYRRATHLVVNSPAYRDYLIAEGVPAGKVSLVPNGVDASMFAPDGAGESVRREYKLAGKFVVTYAGALGLANDIYTLLDAAARLSQHRPEIHFMLVGDGKENSALQHYATKRGLTNVTFTGAQPKQRMAEFLAASDACVAILRDIPMFRTTYPNKVFDYMAAGRPTLLAIDGVIRDVIEKSGGGVFVPPGDADALAATVARLAEDRPLCRRMGSKARDYVCEHFNRDRQADEFCSVLSSVVESA